MATSKTLEGFITITWCYFNKWVQLRPDFFLQTRFNGQQLCMFLFSTVFHYHAQTTNWAAETTERHTARFSVIVSYHENTRTLYDLTYVTNEMFHFIIYIFKTCSLFYDFRYTSLTTEPNANCTFSIFLSLVNLGTLGCFDIVFDSWTRILISPKWLKS